MKARSGLVAAAVAAGVAYAGGTAALGTPPGADSSGAEILAWFSAHGGQARLYAWSSAVMALGLAIALSQVAALLPKPHRYVFLVGAVGWVIELTVQAWFWAGLALHPGDLEPSTALAAFDIALFVGPLVNGATTAMMGAVAALGFGKSPIVPRWLAWLSAVAFAEQAIETITVFGRSGFLAPGGGMNIYLGGLVGVAWGVGVVVWAVRRMGSGNHRAVAEPS